MTVIKVEKFNDVWSHYYCDDGTKQTGRTGELEVGDSVKLNDLGMLVLEIE